MKKISNNENKELCFSCGGKCCQTATGIAVPEDFKEEITLSFLVKLFNSKKWIVDIYKGDIYDRHKKEPGYRDSWYFIRPKSVKDPNMVIYRSNGGACIFWSKESGCSLTFDERPYECKVLVPRIDKKCSIPMDESIYAISQWEPCQEMLLKAGRITEEDWKLEMLNL